MKTFDQLVVTCWDRVDLLAPVCGVKLSVCFFPIGILGQVWYLFVSILDLCTLTYFFPNILAVMHYDLITTVRGHLDQYS